MPKQSKAQAKPRALAPTRQEQLDVLAASLMMMAHVADQKNTPLKQKKRVTLTVAVLLSRILNIGGQLDGIYKRSKAA